jgi:riboflavin synthase
VKACPIDAITLRAAKAGPAETAPLGEMEIGDSISVSGACLTVVGIKSDHNIFFADVSAETLARTTLRHLKAGDRVNLETAVRMSDALGGHLVLGHVDGVGRIAQRTSVAGSVVLGIEFSKNLANYVVEKGSVAVDGVSLTVNALRGSRFFVNVIPFTTRETTLELRKVGDMVNIETDIIGRYVESFVRRGRQIDRAFLSDEGFIETGSGHRHARFYSRLTRA